MTEKTTTEGLARRGVAESAQGAEADVCSSDVIGYHQACEDLVRLGVITPGVSSEDLGVTVFEPMSVQDHSNRVRRGDVEKIAYHTGSMRRGIFTFRLNGEIVNYKGVDSRAGAGNVRIANISKLLGRSRDRHDTVVTYFEHGSYRGHPKNPQIRVTGASQLQDLIKEKDRIDAYGGSHLIKFPKFYGVTVFPEEFSDKYGLPPRVGAYSEFVRQLADADQKDARTGRSGDSRVGCFDSLGLTGVRAGTRGQLWSEYFESLPAHDKARVCGIPGLRIAIREEDGRYALGALFGQATRILGNPFRISDLEFHVRRDERDAVAAILEYTRAREGAHFLLEYAADMGRNTAGFMNEGLANHLWSHRQDYSLSGEICDEAFNDVRASLKRDMSEAQCIRYEELLGREAAGVLTPGGDEHEADALLRNTVVDGAKYYAQILMFASNMKVLEDAHRMVGFGVPQDYQDRFVAECVDNLTDAPGVLAQVLTWGGRLFGEQGRLSRYLGKRAANTMRGFEPYVEDFKRRLRAASVTPAE